MTATDVVPLRPPRAREEATALLGMLVFMGSWAMLFAGLFFAYGIVRVRGGAPWPPPDLPRIPLGLPTIGTLALALSSAALQRALGAVRRAEAARGVSFLAASTAFASLFLGLQIVVWRDLYLGGLRPDTGPYGSVFFGLTFFHGLHVLVGIGALAWLTARRARGAYSAARHVPLRLWTLYWHMVGVVWALLFVLVYLV